MPRKRAGVIVIMVAILLPAFIRVTGTTGWDAMRAVDIVTLLAVGFGAGVLVGSFARRATPPELTSDSNHPR